MKKKIDLQNIERICEKRATYTNWSSFLRYTNIGAKPSLTDKRMESSKNKIVWFFYIARTAGSTKCQKSLLLYKTRDVCAQKQILRSLNEPVKHHL